MKISTLPIITLRMPMALLRDWSRNHLPLPGLLATIRLAYNADLDADGNHHTRSPCFQVVARIASKHPINNITDNMLLWFGWILMS